MALDKDILGVDLYTRATGYNDVDIDPANMEARRLAFWKDISEGIINHFKANGQLNVPGAGLTAGATAVTGTSITGTIL